MYLGRVILPNDSIIHVSVAMCDQNSFYCLYKIDSNGSEIITEKTYYNEEGIQMCQLHDINETLFLFAIICSSKLLVHF